MASRVRSLAGQPFAIPNGQELVLTFGSDGAGAAAAAIRVPLTVGPTLPAQATAGQLADYLRREIRSRLVPGADPPVVKVLPRLARDDTRDPGLGRRARTGGISVQGKPGARSTWSHASTGAPTRARAARRCPRWWSSGSRCRWSAGPAGRSTSRARRSGSAARGRHRWSRSTSATRPVLYMPRVKNFSPNSNITFQLCL